MKCPYCLKVENKVIDSRLVKEEDAIRRRRHCLECNKRFTTYEMSKERLEATPLNVKELAEYLGTAKATIYQSASKGRIPGVKIGRAWRFHKHLIDEWLMEKTIKRRKRPITARKEQQEVRKEVKVILRKKNK